MIDNERAAASSPPPPTAAATPDPSFSLDAPRNHYECVTELRSPEGVRVLVLGTAHISRRSAEDARELAERERPDVLFVELCPNRAHVLTAPPDQAKRYKEVTFQQLKVAATRGGVPAVAMLLLSDYMMRAARHIKVEILPGAEFAAAFQVAVAKYGARVCLGDRDVKVTLRRAWVALSSWERLKVLYAFLRMDMGDFSEEAMEKMKSTDLVTEMFEELSQELPSLMEPLMHERDRYLSYRLRMCCEQLYWTAHAAARDPSSCKVLAIVGMGHVRGIKEHFHKDIDADDYRRISEPPPPPPPRSWLPSRTGALALLGVAAVGVLAWKRWRH